MTKFALSLFAATAVFAGDACASPVTARGEWTTEGGLSRVRIAPCADAAKLCGTIVWLKDPLTDSGKPKTDSKNPDAKFKSRSILGLQFLSNFSAAGPGKWAGGTIYDPQSGKTYKSRLSLNPNGSLKVEGCVLFICRGQTWNRAR